MIADLISALLAGWFFLCIASQFSYFAKRMPDGGMAELLPNWKFFAPEPGTSDFRVVARTYLNGDWSRWTEVFGIERSRLRCLWNPAKFEVKAVFDAVNHLLEEYSSGEDTVALSWPYLVLLQDVVSRTSPGTQKVQFAIIRSQGFIPNREISAAFVSSCHRVEAG